MARRDVRTITKKEIADRLAKGRKLSQADRLSIVQEVLEIITDELSHGHRIELRDFGVFEVKMLAARQAQNPRTLEPVAVPKRPTVRFKPGKGMRESVGRLVAEPPRGAEDPAPMPEPKAGVKPGKLRLVESESHGGNHRLSEASEARSQGGR